MERAGDRSAGGGPQRHFGRTVFQRHPAADAALQFVASPPTENPTYRTRIARAVDLEDSNLFALNRFPANDRWADGGAGDLRRRLGRRLPAWRCAQYRPELRLTTAPRYCHRGTGLSDRFSDIVGRTNVRGRPHHRLHPPLPARQGFAYRRPQRGRRDGRRARTLRTVGYLGSTRDVDPAIEDLREPRGDQFGGRVPSGAARVPVRFGGDRPHQQPKRTAFRPPTVSPGRPNGSASSTTTIASSSASPGGAITRRRSTRAGAIPSCSGWRFAI